LLLFQTNEKDTFSVFINFQETKLILMTALY